MHQAGGVAQLLHFFPDIIIFRHCYPPQLFTSPDMLLVVILQSVEDHFLYLIYLCSRLESGYENHWVLLANSIIM